MRLVSASSVTSGAVLEAVFTTVEKFGVKMAQVRMYTLFTRASPD